MDTVYWMALVVGVVGLAPRVRARILLSRAKHHSLRGHSRWSRRIAARIPWFEYEGEKFFASDGAPAEVAGRRREALRRLEDAAREKCPRSLRVAASLQDGLSDARFTAAYRVPFPYRTGVPEALRAGSVVEETRGVRIRDIDGNWSYDVAGSYGVNVFGHDFYKECIARGAAKVEALGPVLGVHPALVADNVARLKTISGLDEVSFHMSGTEAVMQAVRQARYRTRRHYLVRFCGAYHGWWDGVQPGVGNRRRVGDVLTLADLSEISLRVLETRRDIACVLVNPLQALHPNADAPVDSTLVASDRRAGFDCEAYRQWLVRLREVCTRRGIVLVFDEVFTGFRLGRRGAQGFFGVQADLVTYGKTVAGGLPIGVLCGRADLMKRYREDAPVDVSFARGTFHSHPYVMGAMHEFLHRLETPAVQELHRDLEERWDTRVTALDRRLQRENLPLRVTNLQSVVTVLYTRPSRYNWMLQFYMRAEGLALGWTGTGRLIFSLDYTDADFHEVSERLVRAARRMEDDGWWWPQAELTDRAIHSALMLDMVTARFPRLGVLAGRLRGAKRPAEASHGSMDAHRRPDGSSGPQGVERAGEVA